MSQFTPIVQGQGPAGPQRGWNPVAVALWANAAVLTLILICLVSHNGIPAFLPAARAEQMPSIAGGGGVFIMPAQLAQNQWGCYLLDIDAQTLVAYQYSPQGRKLSFVAARSYKYDRKLHDYSTEPPTKDVQTMIELENQTRKTEPGADKVTEPAPNQP